MSICDKLILNSMLFILFEKHLDHLLKQTPLPLFVVIYCTYPAEVNCREDAVHSKRK